MTADSDIDTLARTIYGEARGEGEEGMRAVACVVINRVTHPAWWGHDVSNVCCTPWQFSCWNKNDPNRSIILAATPSDPVFASANLIAQQAVSGQLVDITEGATSYYDKRMPVPPAWSLQMMRCAEIGHHIFFKEAV